MTETTRRFRDNSVQRLVAGGCALVRARWILAPILVAAALAWFDGDRRLSAGSVDGRGRQRGRWTGDRTDQADQRILVPLGLAAVGLRRIDRPFEDLSPIAAIRICGNGAVFCVVAAGLVGACKPSKRHADPIPVAAALGAATGVCLPLALAAPVPMPSANESRLRKLGLR